MKKYELTDECISIRDTKLYRIKALKDFGDVKAGDLGGFIAKEENLSQEGNSWVYDNAWVLDDAEISDNARVCDNARVFDHAWIFDNAEVHDNLWVCDDTKINGNARVYGHTILCGRSHVYIDPNNEKEENNEN